MLNLPHLFPRKNKLEKKYHALDKISADLLELDEDEIRPVWEKKMSMRNAKTRWDHSFNNVHRIFRKTNTFNSLIRTQHITGWEILVFRKILRTCQLFHDGGRYHIETSPLICSANQWTGFYMITASVMKELEWMNTLKAEFNGNRIKWNFFQEINIAIKTMPMKQVLYPHSWFAKIYHFLLFVLLTQKKCAFAGMTNQVPFHLIIMFNPFQDDSPFIFHLKKMKTRGLVVFSREIKREY